MHELLPPIRRKRRLSWLLYAALALWVGATMASWYGISAYGFTNDPRGVTAAPPQWPAESTMVRSNQGSTLALFLHPKCPCSRATIGELERLSTLVPPAALPEIYIVASAPLSVGETWWSSPLLARAVQLPHSHLVRDRGGVETELFGAHVSGTVILFDADGRRLYAGGVTMSRGHDGDNVGLQSVAKLLVDPHAAAPSIPPFGCAVVHAATSSRSVGGDPR